jgi:hypothetical protein
MSSGKNSTITISTSKILQVLIACEYSGVVRDAFRKLGHNAISCDLLPTEVEGPHYHGDVRDILNDDAWDLIIAHPPCTYLCSSGLHWNKRRPERAALTEEALKFVQLFFDAKCEHVVIENPIGVISTRIKKPTQIIQPWQFGHPETKATCLWIDNLPPLVPTNIVEGREGRVWKMSPNKDRWKERSRTYQGIADAMAKQWSEFLTKQ